MCKSIIHPPSKNVQKLHGKDSYSARWPGVLWVLTRRLHAKPVSSTQLNYNQSPSKSAPGTHSDSRQALKTAVTPNDAIREKIDKVLMDLKKRTRVGRKGEGGLNGGRVHELAKDKGKRRVAIVSGA